MSKGTISINKEYKILLLIILILFISAFLWGMFFTSGFSFFWEDFTSYRLDKEMYPSTIKTPGSTMSSVARLGADYIKNFFNHTRLFQIGFSADFNGRPYAYLNWKLLSTIFTDKIQYYRIFNAAVFALNACLIFLIIHRVSRLFAFLGVAYYLTSAEAWLTLLYSCDMGIYVQCGITASILIFIKLTERNRLSRLQIWFFYLQIIILSNFSVLTKHDGRYLAIVLLLTILFFHRKDFWLHLPPLAVLLFLEAPVLGFMKKVFMDRSFAPINLITHNPLPFFESLRVMAKNYTFPLNALGWFPLLLLFAVIVFHIYSILFRSSSMLIKTNQTHPTLVKERVFLFVLWFLAAFVMVAFARSFGYYTEYDIQLLDLSFFIPPFIIFLCFYIYYVYQLYERQKNRFSVLAFKGCVILLAFGLLLNFIRLNKFRMGWGHYFCAWQNAEGYIEQNSDKALALIVNRMVYKPFLFLHSKNKVVVSEPPVIPSPFCDMEYIERQFLSSGYKDIFVAGWGKQDFKGKSVKVALTEVRAIDGDCGSAYDRLIRLGGFFDLMKSRYRPNMNKVYLYHFKIVSQKDK